MNDKATDLRSDHVLMERIVIHLLASMLKKRQCVSSLISIFAAVRHTVLMFEQAFFVDPTPFCGDIVYGILLHSNSSFPEIRSKAAGLIYLLIRVKTFL